VATTARAIGAAPVDANEILGGLFREFDPHVGPASAEYATLTDFWSNSGGAEMARARNDALGVLGVSFDEAEVTTNAPERFGIMIGFEASQLLRRFRNADEGD
jgi:hypothetical protein